MYVAVEGFNYVAYLDESMGIAMNLKNTCIILSEKSFIKLSTVYRESFAKENVCDFRDFWCIREHFLAELHVRNESYIYI